MMTKSAMIIASTKGIFNMKQIKQLKKMKKAVFVLAALLSTVLCGCVYHPPVQQGNILSRAKVSMIHNGMSPQEVTAQLGSPVLQNMYSDNRLTYIYTNQTNRSDFSAKRVIIQFQNNQVVNVQSDL